MDLRDVQRHAPRGSAMFVHRHAPRAGDARTSSLRGAPTAVRRRDVLSRGRRRRRPRLLEPRRVRADSACKPSTRARPPSASPTSRRRIRRSTCRNTGTESTTAPRVIARGRRARRAGGGAFRRFHPDPTHRGEPRRDVLVGETAVHGFRRSGFASGSRRRAMGRHPTNTVEGCSGSWTSCETRSGRKTARVSSSPR